MSNNIKQNIQEIFPERTLEKARRDLLRHDRICLETAGEINWLIGTGKPDDPAIKPLLDRLRAKLQRQKARKEEAKLTLQALEERLLRDTKK